MFRYIVTTGRMIFKEVKAEDRINPWKPGLALESYLGYKIDLCDWNGDYKYRVWWNGNEAQFFLNLEQCEQSIIRTIVES